MAAPSGGGGGGGPVGFAHGAAGTGQGINYIGDHVYGFSGQVTSGDGTTVTMLDFTTAAGSYIVGTVQFGFGGAKSNDDERGELLIDGQISASMLFNNNYERAELNDFQVILPPSSRIQVRIVKVSGVADVPSFSWLRGRVYA
jgi:hypothetical protein